MKKFSLGTLILFLDESNALVEPTVGMACVAKYTDDGSWYRGKSLNIKDSYLDILFVDYGNKQRTPINLVKAVEEELVVLPPQAYHCSMSEVL